MPVNVDRDDNIEGADSRGMDSKDVCTDTFLKVLNTDSAISCSSYEGIAVVKSRGQIPLSWPSRVWRSAPVSAL